MMHFHSTTHVDTRRSEGGVWCTFIRRRVLISGGAKGETKWVCAVCPYVFYVPDYVRDGDGTGWGRKSFVQ